MRDDGSPYLLRWPVEARRGKGIGPIHARARKDQTKTACGLLIPAGAELDLSIDPFALRIHACGKCMTKRGFVTRKAS